MWPLRFSQPSQKWVGYSWLATTLATNLWPHCANWEKIDASQCIAVLSLLVQSLCRNYIASIDHISFLLLDLKFELYLHLLHANRSQRLRVGRGTEEDRNVWIHTLRRMSPDVWVVVLSSILSSDVDNYLDNFSRQSLHQLLSKDNLFNQTHCTGVRELL